jgi:hypothetical protein
MDFYVIVLSWVPLDGKFYRLSIDMATRNDIVNIWEVMSKMSKYKELKLNR